MLRNLMLFALALCVAAAAGCSSGEQSQAEQAAGSGGYKGDASDDVQTASAETEMQVELGCGSCIYHKDGVEGCQTAAKIGDEIVMVKGTEIDAHGLGLCAAPRQATVKGKLEDGVLIASAVELAPEAE